MRAVFSPTLRSLASSYIWGSQPPPPRPSTSCRPSISSHRPVTSYGISCATSARSCSTGTSAAWRARRPSGSSSTPKPSGRTSRPGVRARRLALHGACLHVAPQSSRSPSALPLPWRWKRVRQPHHRLCLAPAAGHSPGARAGVGHGARRRDVGARGPGRAARRCCGSTGTNTWSSARSSSVSSVLPAARRLRSDRPLASQTGAADPGA